MFWGLIMEPKRRYTQTVKKSFHISMAALDITSGSKDPAQVLLNYDDRNYLLCTLQIGKDVQVPLDLNFEEGDEVSFATNGSSHVHLTGYLIKDELEELEEEEEDDVETKNATTESKNKKRKSAQENSPLVSKKSKTEQLLDAVNAEASESDSDDMNFSDILKGEGDEEEGDEEASDEEADEEEGDDEEESDELEEEESEDEGSSLSEGDDVPALKEAKVNGFTPTPTSKKKEKKKEQVQEKQKQEKTPKGNKENQENKITKKDGKTPAKEGKTPQKEGKQGKEGKTPAKDGKTPGKEGKTPGKDQKQSPEKQQNQQKRTLEGGVQIQDLVVGNGPIAKPGKVVQVYYEGRLKSNNKVFDSAKQGIGFKFRLGQHEVIKGWDVGVQGMKVGGKRRIICPPNMAYGQKGSPPAIPANSTLVFEVELKNVH